MYIDVQVVVTVSAANLTKKSRPLDYIEIPPDMTCVIASEDSSGGRRVHFSRGDLSAITVTFKIIEPPFNKCDSKTANLTIFSHIHEHNLGSSKSIQNILNV